MDATLRPSRRGRLRDQERNFRAWERRYANPDLTCRHCPHDNTTHLSASGQPHFFTREGKRKIVAKYVEIILAFCTACAEEIGTSQVICYKRSIAVGERLGRANGRYESL